MAGQVKLTLLITSVLKGKDAYKQTQQGLQGVGKGAGFAATAMKALAAVGISAFFVSSIKKAAEFSDTMAAVQAATGATEEQFKALGDEAKRIGAEFGKFTAAEAAEGMRVLSFAGFSVEETLTAIEPVMKLSQAGMMELGEAANAVAGSLRSFGFNASETERVVDIMTKTFVSSNTSMQQLSDAIRFVGPIAAQAGISFEEMNATLGVLANSAIKGGQAGTNLRNILIRLQAPSNEARQTLSELGVSIFELPAAAQAAEQALNADFTELQRLALQMADAKNSANTLEESINDLALETSRNSLEIEKHKNAIEDIKSGYVEWRGEIDSLEADILGLKDVMAGFSLDAKKNNLEIMEIRQRADRESKKLTEDELKRIKELEEANDEIAIERERASIKQIETEIKLDTERDKVAAKEAERQKAVEEELTAINELEKANKDLSREELELNIQKNELKINEEKLKESIDATKESINTNSEAFDSAKGPLKSMAEVATEFNVAMESLSKAQQTEALATIFGSRNIAAFQVIMRSMSEDVGEGQQTLQAYTETLSESGGTADEVSAIMETGLGNQIAQVQSAFEAFQLEMVAAFMPTLLELMTIAKDDLIPALSELVPVIAGIIGVIGVLAEFLAPVLVLLAETPGLIEALVIGLIAWKIAQIAVNIAMMANPIGLIILAIIALIVIIWVLVANWDEVSAALLASWEDFKAGFQVITDAIAGAFTALGENITAVFDSIRDTIMEVWDTINAFVDMITGLPDRVSGAIGDITGGLGIELPSFAGGGIVPGPLGSPQLIVAHGGEPFGDAAGGSGGGGNSVTSNDTINLNVTVGGAMDEASVNEMSTMLAEQVVEKKRRAEQGLLTEGS